MEVDGSFGATAHTKKIVRVPFPILHIKFVDDRGTWIDTHGSQSVLKVYNIHCCTPTLFNGWDNQVDDKECNKILRSSTQYH